MISSFYGAIFKMDVGSIDEFLEQWSATDQKVENELDVIREYSVTNKSLENDISRKRSQLLETKNDLNILINNFSRLAGDREVIKVQLEARKVNYEETKDLQNDSKENWEAAQMEIWKMRRTFCDEVKSFVQKYGIKTTLHSNFEQKVRLQIVNALDDIDTDSGKNVEPKKKSEEIIRMESDITKDKRILEELEIKLASFKNSDQELHGGLENAETESLRNALKYSVDETAKHEEQLSALKMQLDTMNTHIINDLFEDKATAEEYPKHGEKLFARQYTSTQYANKSTSNSEFRSAKDVYMSDGNFLTVVSEHPPNWSIRSNNTPSSSLMHWQHDEPNVYPDENFEIPEEDLSVVKSMSKLKNDPYKQIFEMRDNKKENIKRQKAKFNLVNNFRN